MGITSILTLRIYGDTYDEILMISRGRISDFFEIDESEIDSKINYEISIKENQEMESQAIYESIVTVRGRDVV